jgi:hypothetical protein
MRKRALRWVNWQHPLRPPLTQQVRAMFVAWSPASFFGLRSRLCSPLRSVRVHRPAFKKNLATGADSTAISGMSSNTSWVLLFAAVCRQGTTLFQRGKARILSRKLNCQTLLLGWWSAVRPRSHVGTRRLSRHGPLPISSHLCTLNHLKRPDANQHLQKEWRMNNQGTSLPPTVCPTPECASEVSVHRGMPAASHSALGSLIAS